MKLRAPHVKCLFVLFFKFSILSYDNLGLKRDELKFLYKSFTCPNACLLPEYGNINRMCVCVCVFLMSALTLHLVMQQPHMRDRTPNTSMTQLLIATFLAEIKQNCSIRAACGFTLKPLPRRASNTEPVMSWMSGFTCDVCSKWTHTFIYAYVHLPLCTLVCVLQWRWPLMSNYSAVTLWSVQRASVLWLKAYTCALHTHTHTYECVCKYSRKILCECVCHDDHHPLITSIVAASNQPLCPSCRPNTDVADLQTYH